MEFLAGIDRIEGDTAVLLPSGESRVRSGPRAKLIWPVALLPDGAREGDLLRVRCDIDAEATSAAGTRARDLLKGLNSPPPGGRNE